MIYYEYKVGLLKKITLNLEVADESGVYASILIICNKSQAK